MNASFPPGGPITVRRWHIVIEDIETEGGRSLDPVLRRVVVAAVINNPLVGQWQEDLTVLIDAGETLGAELMRRAKDLLGMPVTSYGKAGIVGVDGELEHLAAVLHPKFGHPVRSAVDGVAILQSTKKRGAPGVAVDIPLSHVKAMMIRSHFDATTFAVPDAPLPNELVICLAVSGGPRAHQRVGGLTETEAVGEDGMR